MSNLPVLVRGIRSTNAYRSGSHRSDGDFFVYLEGVDENGTSTCRSEGGLRASNRGGVPAPYGAAGLPYLRACRRDAEPMPEGGRVLLEIPMQPTAKLFDQGRRIRITVTGADRANFGDGIAPEDPPRIGVQPDPAGARSRELAALRPRVYGRGPAVRAGPGPGQRDGTPDRRRPPDSGGPTSISTRDGFDPAVARRYCGSPRIVRPA